MHSEDSHQQMESIWHNSDTDKKTKKKLAREAVKKPIAILKELQLFLPRTVCPLHVTTPVYPDISRFLHMCGLSKSV